MAGLAAPAWRRATPDGSDPIRARFKVLRLTDTVSLSLASTCMLSYPTFDAM